MNPQSLWKNKKPEVICGTLSFLMVTGLTDLLIHRLLYVDTQYATVEANFIPLAPQVIGEVREVLVSEHQAVKKGQILCKIDDRPYLAALDLAVAARDAMVPQLRVAEKDRDRVRYQIAHGAVSRAELTHAESLVHNLRARARSADADVLTARVQIARTNLIAPEDGVLAFRSARVGMTVQPGFALFGFIANQTRWVEARLKETDLRSFRVGDHARVRVDAMPGRDFNGTVESLAATSETPFAAVPNDFTAGNYSRYVQWIPVRIKLDLKPADQARIPVGGNASIQIRRRSS